MTRDELQVRLQNYFENNTYFSNTDFVASIQDGYDEAVASTGIIIKATTLAFQKDLSYYDLRTLIPDYLGVIAIFNSLTKRWLLPTSINKLDRHRYDWEICYGTPEYFSAISFRYMALFRKPHVVGYGNMYIYYAATAPTLSSSDTILIPDDYLTTLEDYCITDLQEQQQEWNKAGRHFESYVSNLEELRVWCKNRRMSDRVPSL